MTILQTFVQIPAASRKMGRKPKFEVENTLSSTQPLTPVRWKTEEFRSAVLNIEPRTAVFDCDGTLWSGDAGSGFMDWSLEQGLVSRSASDWIDTRYRGYKNGTVSELTICGEMVQLYAGLREQEIRTAVEEYFPTQIEPGIFPEMKELVFTLQQAGTEIWAVSSTNNWIIEEGMKRFNIPVERILSSRVKVQNGTITSELIDVPTDEGKASALNRAGLPNPDAVFGNSIHDAAMLEIARQAFPINPTVALQELAAEKGWPIYFPISGVGSR
jgi:phosphoserine phosphatase